MDPVEKIINDKYPEIIKIGLYDMKVSLDTIHDAIERMLKRKGSIKREEVTGAFFRVCIRNTQNDYHRVKRNVLNDTMVSIEDLFTSKEFSVLSTEVEMAEFQHIVYSLVKEKCSKRNQQIFKLFIEGYKFREIGEKLHMHENTVRSVIYPLLKWLRKSINKYYEENKDMV